jgi:hypothetical protein
MWPTTVGVGVLACRGGRGVVAGLGLASHERGRGAERWRKPAPVGAGELGEELGLANAHRGTGGRMVLWSGVTGWVWNFGCGDSRRTFYGIDGWSQVDEVWFGVLP